MRDRVVFLSSRNLFNCLFATGRLAIRRLVGFKHCDAARATSVENPWLVGQAMIARSHACD